MDASKKMMPSIIAAERYPDYSRKSVGSLASKSQCFSTSKSQKKRLKGGVLASVGASLLMFALFMFVAQPLDMAVEVALKFAQDSFIFENWKQPPIKISLKFYIFNYTNSEAFLKGDEKLAIQEIGPYSYTEVTTYRNITFNDNNTFSYVPVRSAIEDPEVTIGDPFKDIIVVPNFAFLGLASYLSESSLFTNMAFNVFSRMVKSEPFLTMTVDEYLRGYDEPLLGYANKLVPGLVTFGKMGYLDRVLNEGENIVTLNLNDKTEALPGGRVIEPFTVDRFNGEQGLSEWGFDPDDNDTHLSCNTLQGLATEGTLIPRRMHETAVIQLYRKSFCRMLPVVYDRPGQTSFGVPAFWLKFAEDTFHNSNPENSCYCHAEEGDCLPEGLTDIGACLFDMPVALSAPHFLYGDPKLLEPWDSLNPKPTLHESTGLVDSKFGVIIHAHLRIQLNLIVRQTKYNTIVRPFNNMVMPAIWMEYNLNDLPNNFHTLLFLAAVGVPILHHVITAAAILIGMALVLRSMVDFFNARTEYRRLHRANSSIKRTDDGDENTFHS